MDGVTHGPVGDAKRIFEAALERVQADRLLERAGWLRWLQQPPDRYRRIRVVGMGKAAMAMAGVVERQLGDRVAEGVVVVPRGYPATLPGRFARPARIAVREGAHPVPDATSVQAARQILETAGRCGDGDLLIVLISGGGTALCADFVESITLEDAQRTFRLLLEGGADIHAMNAVRKHLSRVGGGQLARAAAPAEVLALVISDVVGDDLSVIASGPTVPDPTNFAEAVAVLRGHGLWEATPARVKAHLEAGSYDPTLETPKPGSPLFERVRTELVGGNGDALAAAREAAQACGYPAEIQADPLVGEARDAGRRLAEIIAAQEQPRCLLWGGETTVIVRGGGRGGRNQELVLAAAPVLERAGRPVVLLSGGTDGRDGPTDAAGAWATRHTAQEARRRGLDPADYLARNDAYPFFEALDALLKTGPTHTNVMDLQVGLVGEVEGRS